ncbi:hypothetical protein ACFX5K_02525 [Rickettsiales bacterium LUAb2]
MNENQLNRALKSTIIIVTLLVLVSTTLIIIGLIKKKSEKFTNNNDYGNIQNITQINSAFPANCNPVDTQFKENYIILFSKKCNLIKVIDLNHQKNYNIQY